MFFDTVLFDLDDTIHDRDKSLCVFFDLLILNYCDAPFHGSIPELKRSFIKNDNRGYVPREDVFRELQAGLPGKRKPDIKDLIDFWITEFPKCARPMPRVYDVFEHLIAKGIKMGIVTNGASEFQQTKIDKLNFRKYMKIIVISGEAGIEKPDTRIFRIALSEIDSTNKTTLFVGDHPVNDIKGASDAGLKTVWLSRGQAWNMKNCTPHFIIDDISELIGLSDIITCSDLYDDAEQ